MKNGGLREENFETRRNFSEKKDKRRKKSQKGGNIPKGGQLVALYYLMDAPGSNPSSFTYLKLWQG